MSASEIINIDHEGIQSVVTLVPGLSNQISDLSQTIDKQNNIISDLNTRLKRLEQQSKKTSKNNRLPPSTDGVKKTKSLHQPSTHTPVAQAGHKGTTLKRVETPDVMLKHLPNTCLGCGETLENISV